MTYEQWLRFQSFARTVLEPRNNVQLEELNKEICEPSSNRIGEPLMAFFASERWAKKYMFHHNTRNDERLAFELLCRVSFFAGCTANEDELDFKPEVKSILWTEIRRICTELEPHLPEPDRAALLALLPVEDAAPVALSASESTTPPPERRLGRLRELGGNVKYKNGKWRIMGITQLVKSEKKEGHKRSDEKTIRADLIEAAENEREAKRAGFFP